MHLPPPSPVQNMMTPDGHGVNTFQYGAGGSPALSEAFFLQLERERSERERERADRAERAAERERSERAEREVRLTLVLLAAAAAVVSISVVTVWRR